MKTNQLLQALDEITTSLVMTLAELRKSVTDPTEDFLEAVEEAVDAEVAFASSEIESAQGYIESARDELDRAEREAESAKEAIEGLSGSIVEALRAKFEAEAPRAVLEVVD